MYNNYIHLYIIILYIITNKRFLLLLYKSCITHYFLVNKKIIESDKVDFYIQELYD